jgi:adenosine/AMP kinase
LSTIKLIAVCQAKSELSSRAQQNNEGLFRYREGKRAHKIAAHAKCCYLVSHSHLPIFFVRFIRRSPSIGTEQSKAMNPLNIFISISEHEVNKGPSVDYH